MSDINFEEINLKKSVFIDVRSPSEFKKGHIVDAINVPILNDEQRAIVGTTYKQKGQSEAISIGLELAGPNFLKIYEYLLNIKDKNPSKELIIYCARGGMRSGTVYSLMSTLKIKSKKLIGGYKKYRNVVLDLIERKLPKNKFIIINGYTGSGKTTLLKKMEKENFAIIDLEAIAEHMGSAFGSIPYHGAKTSQQQFENRLAMAVLEHKNEKVIFIEGESRRIGWININKAFHEKMTTSDMVVIKRSEEFRISKILEDYDIHSFKFKNALNRINRKLGGEKYKEIVKLLESNQEREVIRELLNSYYDKKYTHSISKNKNLILEIENDNDEIIINELKKLL